MCHMELLELENQHTTSWQCHSMPSPKMLKVRRLSSDDRCDYKYCTKPCHRNLTLGISWQGVPPLVLADKTRDDGDTRPSGHRKKLCLITQWFVDHRELMMRIPLKEMMAVSQNPGCPKLGVFPPENGNTNQMAWPNSDPTPPVLRTDAETFQPLRLQNLGYPEIPLKMGGSTTVNWPFQFMWIGIMWDNE